MLGAADPRGRGAISHAGAAVVVELLGTRAADVPPPPPLRETADAPPLPPLVADAVARRAGGGARRALAALRVAQLEENALGGEAAAALIDALRVAAPALSELSLRRNGVAVNVSGLSQPILMALPVEVALDLDRSRANGFHIDITVDSRRCDSRGEAAGGSSAGCSTMSDTCSGRTKKRSSLRR